MHTMKYANDFELNIYSRNVYI